MPLGYRLLRAVVAKQVRSLAQGCASPAQRVDQTESAAGTIHNLLDSVRHVAATIGQIANATEHQGQGVDAVESALNDIERLNQTLSRNPEQDPAHRDAGPRLQLVRR